MFSHLLVVLAAFACSQALPQLLFQPSGAQGQSGSTVTKGETIGPGGISTIIQQQAGTGGNAFGSGLNFGTATGSTQSQTGLFGSGSSSKTDAQSVQSSIPTIGFGHGAGIPGFPVIPVLPSSATGQANAGLTTGETIGPGGVKTTITQLGATAGGSAENGGTSVNTAHGSTSSSSGVLGSSNQSNLGATSVQTGR